MTHRIIDEGKTPSSVSGWLVLLCLILSVVTAIVVGMGRLLNAPWVLLFTAKLVFIVATAGALVLPLVRRWLGEARTTEWVKNLALVIGTLTVMTVLAEIGLRALFSDVTTTNDNSSYWARRWIATHVHLNRLGYRDREFPVQKPSGVFRIAVVGDSNTFGQGIEEGDRFTNRLQVALNRGGQRFEVLNFGRPGAETMDEVQMLKDTVVNLQPDYVLLQWFINDVEGRDKTGKFDPLPLLPWETLRSVLHGNSVIYYMLEQDWYTVQQQLGWIKPFEEWMARRFGDPNSPWTREGMEQLHAFLETCRVSGIPMGIVLFPNLTSIREHDYVFAFLHEYVLTFCAQEDLNCLDLRQSMARVAPRVALTISRFDGHPNAEANRIATEEIMKRFGPIWDSAAGGQRAGPRSQISLLF